MLKLWRSFHFLSCRLRNLLAPLLVCVSGPCRQGGVLRGGNGFCVPSYLGIVCFDPSLFDIFCYGLMCPVRHLLVLICRLDTFVICLLEKRRVMIRASCFHTCCSVGGEYTSKSNVALVALDAPQMVLTALACTLSKTSCFSLVYVFPHASIRPDRVGIQYLR